MGPSADLSASSTTLRAADVAEPIAVAVALHLADQLRAVGSQPATTASMSSTTNARWRMPRVFAGASGSPSRRRRGVKFVSSSRPWPSGASTIAKSTRTPSSPTTRSTQPSSTAPLPAARVRARRRTPSQPRGRRPRCPRDPCVGPSRARLGDTRSFHSGERIETRDSGLCAGERQLVASAVAHILCPGSAANFRGIGFQQGASSRVDDRIRTGDRLDHKSVDHGHLAD